MHALPSHLHATAKMFPGHCNNSIPEKGTAQLKAQARNEVTREKEI